MPLKPPPKYGPSDTLLTLREAASRLGVCTRTVRRSIARDKIYAIKLRIGVGEGVWRVPLAEVERLITEGADSW